MLNLQRVATFTAVVEAGSFTAAAAKLGQTKAVVSFHLRQLEAELGIALLLRTTRRLALTEAGENFYRRGKALLQEAENILEDAQRHHQELTGELRITSTPEYGAGFVVPALAAFSQKHPQLRIRHVSSSQQADLIAEGFDMGIRLGTLADSSYRAALIQRFAILPVAAPEWIEQHPVASLEALAKAEWIIHERLPTPYHWQLKHEEKAVSLTLAGKARLSADSAAALLAFALAGNGVALLPDWLVEPALQNGTLRQLLPEYQFPAQGIYAVYPDTRHLPEKARAFIDFLRAWVGA